MDELGKGLFFLGIGLAVVGLVLWSGFGRDWLGRLPGDVALGKGNVRFYFPIMTCLLLSALLSLILWLFRK